MKDLPKARRAYLAFTQITRIINKFMRETLSSGPITVQQCYALEALLNGPLRMADLADQVALHQSTLTRVVEKLEKQHLLIRRRKPDNQRIVEVEITEKGKTLYVELYSQCLQSIEKLLVSLPQNIQSETINSLEFLASILNPKGSAYQDLLCGCVK